MFRITRAPITPGIQPAIVRSVTKLSDHYQDISLADADKEIDHIKQQSETILELLSHKFNPVSHE